ncbi:MAG: hypothetical protein RIC85_01285 [Gammaproteobacteria bacterium]
MNWDAVGAIGEIVGALAVVITLGFLIHQLRQNTIALRQQSERDSATAFQQWSLTTVAPSTARAIGRAWIEVDEKLTPEEMISVEHFTLSFLFVLLQDYLDWKRGFQSDDVWTSRVGLIEAVFSSPAVRAWWHLYGRSYVIPEFRRIIEAKISENPKDGGDYWKLFREGAA